MTTIAKVRYPYTGASNLRIDDIFNTAIDAKKFGAVGNYNENTGAGADDTAAIQTAIDAASAHSPGHAAVRIPAGAYKCTANLNIPYGVSIFGDGGTASVMHFVGCDGLHFTTYGTSIGQVFFEDFGLTAVSGSNFTGILTAANASTMDGLKFHRLRLYGWNVAIDFRANNECTVQTCVFENINAGIAISNGNGTCTGIRIFGNRIVHAAGGNGTGASVGVKCYSTSGFSEAIFIQDNKIYGFATDIALDQALYVNVLDNDLSATTTSITYTAAEGGYNICDNYIECVGGMGIAAAAQGADTTQAKANIERNYFQGTTAATIGIRLGASGGTNQFNANIRNNTFIGFTTNDIALYSPGRTTLEGNRCLSTAPTNSIFVEAVAAAPVILRRNWLWKALFLDAPTDVVSGTLILEENVESNSFQTRRRSAAPVNGTWRVGDIVYNNAPASAGYIGFVCTAAGSPGTWKSFGLIA